MRIIRAVKNLLFPHSLSEKLSLLWFPICAGSLRSLLTCSTHTSGLFSQEFLLPKSWKCSRERVVVQAVFKLGLMRGGSEASVRESLQQLVASQRCILVPSYPSCNQLHIVLPFSTLMLVDVTGFQ